MTNGAYVVQCRKNKKVNGLSFSLLTFLFVPPQGSFIDIETERVKTLFRGGVTLYL